MIYDPFDGESDIKNGHIRFIGSPEQRITEDALRILRLFRFQAHYGQMPLDDNALTAVKKAAPMIKNLSVERIASEMRNSGVFHFAQDYITFDLDTIGTNKKVNVEIKIKTGNYFSAEEKRSMEIVGTFFRRNNKGAVRAPKD